MEEHSEQPDAQVATDEASDAAPPERAPFLRSIGGWASAVLCLVVIAALALGYGPMRARAAGMNAATPRVQFDWPPLAGMTSSQPAPGETEPRTWVNGEIRSELQSLTLAKLGTDPFDKTALGAAREALIGTGWFSDDLRLTRELTGNVRVSGNWRVPAAAVRTGDQDMLVSFGGERLPVTYRAGGSGYRVILGASQEPPEAGKAWVGGDVQAALKLLELVRTLPGADQIAGVDVSEYSHARSLALVTDAGNRILWGGPVDDFNPGQATPSVKAARLVEIYREYGRIDAGRAVLDVRLIDGVYIHDTTGVMDRARQAAEAARSNKSKPKATGRH